MSEPETITVSELIELLRAFPGDLPVFTWDSEYGHEPAGKPEMVNRWSYGSWVDKSRYFHIGEKEPKLVGEVRPETPVVVLR